MHFLSSLAVLSYLSFVYSSLVIPASESSPFSSTNPQNANHIFNAIHSSMRQWGSSLNHNGMSFFLATVPAGTQLYHGSSKEEFVQGMEWLAFEPEHALIFARAWRGPRRPPPEEGDDGRDAVFDGEEHEEGHGPEDNDGEYWRGPNFMPPEHDQEHMDKHHGRPHAPPPPPPPPPPGPPPHEPPFEHHGPPPMPPPNHGKPPMHDMPPPPPPPPPHRRPPPEHDMPIPPPPPSHGKPPKDDFPPPPPPPPPSHGKPPKHNMPPPPPPPPPHHRPPPEHGVPHPPKPPYGQPPNGRPPNNKPFHEPPHRRERKRPQHPFNVNGATPNAENPEPLPGYLHTYAPPKDLHLLYIDGMSAGKTSNGTLDGQDKLLLNLTSDQCQGMMCERERARGLCDMAKGVWKDKIDGVLRMEGGFEIILCDFERDLERIDVMKVVEGSNWAGGGMMGGWRYIQAVADRYHGIGGGRVSIDYEHFVTVFDYPELDLFTNDVNSDMPMPRLQNVADSDLIKIKDAVTDMVLARESEEATAGTNWQEVVDSVVKRYSKHLHYLATNRDLRDSKESFAEYLGTLLRPFIDWTARNSTLEIARCGAQLVPRLHNPPALASSLAHRAAYTVNNEICLALLSALDVTMQSMSHSLSHGAPPSRALDLVDSLVDYLQWTTWKECGTCRDEEVCVIPIWPMGTFEDHAHPKCKTEGGDVGMGDYWGHPRRHGPPPEDGPGGGRGRGNGRGHGVEGGGAGKMQLHHKGCGSGRRALGWLRARILGMLRGLGLRW